jgi:hypothetical protein
MLRYAVAIVLLTALLPTAPSSALTPKQRMETCKFGADDQKLKGPARKKFIDKCMSNKDDPRGPAASAPMAPPPGPPPPPPSR